MNQRQMRLPALTCFAILSVALGCTPESPIDATLQMLRRVREQKSEQLTNYFGMIEENVEQVQTDSELIFAFDGLLDLYNGAEAAETASHYDRVVTERYIEDYQLFFDVHFIATDGSIFYTVLKQDDLFGNLFSDEFSTWNLSTALRERPDESVVDFQIVDFSSEPSAFFAEPVAIDGEKRGWIVLQYASSRLDNLFGHDPALGQTGEVFLVNQNHFMMTRSQNQSQPSVLQQHLSDENIETKFALGEGELEVVDYRGYRCLTSFAVTDVLGVPWLLIAKMDVAEAVTREYLERDRNYYEKIREELRSRPAPESDARAITNTATTDETVRVYLDTYERIDGNASLETPGVATCTTLIVALPGEFAYMAHISPYDRVYDGSRTDLVSSILHQITSFEIPDKRIREIEVTLVTPRIQYSDSLITEFARAGIFLSQITVIKNPSARCADVHYQLPTNETLVTWCNSAGEPVTVQRRDQTPSVGTIMETFL
jgi:hypothetical protein